MAQSLPNGYRRQDHAELPSTSTTALAALQAGEPDGLWVTAGRQLAGRGRRGRHWSTETGNLAASLALVDPASRDDVATLSFVAGLALHQAIVDVAGPMVVERLALKWPNDLLLDRHKIAGILLEGAQLASGGFGVVIGFGVNCVSHPEIEGAFPAADLTSKGIAISAEDLFAALATTMAREITRWDEGAGFAAVRTAWLQRAIGVDEAIEVRLPDRTLSGVFESLDASGQLVLRHQDGRREIITAGDVFFAGADYGD